MSQGGPMTVDQAFALALQHHQAGRLPQAEGLYRQILAVQPAHGDSLHLLGVMAIQVNRAAEAVELIEKAIATVEAGGGGGGGMRGGVPGSYWSNLGEAYRVMGALERALACFVRAQAMDPGLADAAVNELNCLVQMDRPQEALAASMGHLRRFPQVAALYRLQADALVKLRRLEEAVTSYRQAARMSPSLLEAHFNLGVALLNLGRANEAVPCFLAALKLNPNDLDGWMGLADAYSRIGYSREALGAYEEVLKRDPGHAGAHAGQGIEYRVLDRLDESIAAYRRSLAIKPDDQTVTVNLALSLRDAGQLEESSALLRSAVEARPDHAAMHSASIMTLYLLPWVSEGEIEAELARWQERHAAPLPRRVHVRTPEGMGAGAAGGRRLRVGYVSADLRNHPVGRFMKPVLEHHDRTRVEVFCYSVSARPDTTMQALQRKAEHWCSAAALTPEELADQIHRDGIDVLVDLSMHTIDNALLTFARKPAPVQMTYLAYCAGTGLHAIDWRLTDAQIDPPQEGAAEEARTYERPLRLETYWCYAPHAAAEHLEVSPLPALATGNRGRRVTLGSFNFFSKANDEVLEAWAELLLEMPDARLVLHVPGAGGDTGGGRGGGGEGSMQERVRRFFSARGIGGERLELVGRVGEAAYFARYGQIDIALDTYPFAGGTTTCDALWMGVPVVTRAGVGAEGRSTARGGASILTALGHPEWIARDWPGYRAIVRSLAADLETLAALRAGLRDQMRRSILMDAPRFVRRLEEAYQQAWNHWQRG